MNRAAKFGIAAAALAVLGGGAWYVFAPRRPPPPRSDVRTFVPPRLKPPKIKLESLPEKPLAGLTAADFGTIENVGDVVTATNAAAGAVVKDIGRDLTERANNALDAVKNFAGLGEKRRVLTDPVLNAPIAPPTEEDGTPVRFSSPAHAKFTAAYPTKYDGMIAAAADRAGISPAWLKQVLIAESSLNPNAKAKSSSAGGLGQFVDATWREWSEKVFGEQKSKFDATAAIPVSAAYLQWLKEETGSEYSATIAYHAGIGTWRRDGDDGVRSDFRRYAEKITRRAGLPRPADPGLDADDFAP